MQCIRPLVLAAIAAAVLVMPPAHAAEEPPHTVTYSSGSIEIREYAPMILAEVEVSGNMETAGNRGFRPLASFIFGDNKVPGGTSSADIAMTSPVIQTKSEKIAMTSPVIQARGQDETWRVAFVMPSNWSMETLPRPNDGRVEIRQVPARRLAAIRFAGGPNEEKFRAKAEQLESFLKEKGYRISGEPFYARYDPPWTPTFFRRNEVLIELEL